MLSGLNQEVGDDAIRHLSNIEIIIPHQEIKLSFTGQGRSDVKIFECEPLEAEIDNHTDFPVRGLIVNNDRAFLDVVSGNLSSIGGQSVTSLLLFLNTTLRRLAPFGRTNTASAPVHVCSKTHAQPINIETI